MDTTNSDQVHTQGFRSNRTQLQEYNYHKEIKDHDNNKFNYRQVIGKMLYLEKSTRPDISCAVHQCARNWEIPVRNTGERPGDETKPKWIRMLG
jgi:hypothetical protein